MALMPGGVINSGLSGTLSREVLDPGTTMNMDPGFQRNLLLEQARREVEGSGKRPGDPGFTLLAVNALRTRGLEDEATKAQQRGEQAEAGALRGLPPRNAEEESRASLLRQLDPSMPAREAGAIARNKKLFDKRVEAMTKPMGGLEAQRYQLPNGQPADPSKSLLENVRNGAQLLDPVDVARRRSNEISRAATKEEADETLAAVSSMKEIMKEFRSSGTLSGVLSALGGRIGMTSDQGVYSAALSRIAKSIAQLRNPGSAEAAREAEIRLNETFPELEFSIGTERLDALLEFYTNEANDRLGKKKKDPGDTDDPLIDKWLRKSRGQ